MPVEVDTRFELYSKSETTARRTSNHRHDQSTITAAPGPEQSNTPSTSALQQRPPCDRHKQANGHPRDLEHLFHESTEQSLSDPPGRCLWSALAAAQQSSDGTRLDSIPRNDRQPGPASSALCTHRDSGCRRWQSVRARPAIIIFVAVRLIYQVQCRRQRGRCGAPETDEVLFFVSRGARSELSSPKPCRVTTIVPYSVSVR